MAMKINTEGLMRVADILNQLGDKAQDVASGALFEGAGIVADAFTGAINGISTAPFKYAKPGGQKRKPSPEEKEILIGQVGIAEFHKSGSEVDTLIGIGEGYNTVDWNHMSSKAHTNYKVKPGHGYYGVISNSKAYIRKKDDHYERDRDWFIKNEGRRSSAKPVKVIARAINSGTSFMEKQPFARKAKSQSQGAAKAAIVSKAEEMLEELIK